MEDAIDRTRVQEVEALKLLVGQGFNREATLLGTSLAGAATGEGDYGLRSFLFDLQVMNGCAQQALEGLDLEGAPAVVSLPGGITAAAVFGLTIADRKSGAAAAKKLLDKPDEITPAQSVASWTALSNAAWDQGNLSSALCWGRYAAEAATSELPTHQRPYPQLTFARKLGEAGAISEAEMIVDKVRQEVKLFDIVAHAAAPDIIHSRILLRAGSVRAAEEAARRGVEVSRKRGTKMLLPFALTVLAQAALRRGDHDESRRYLETVQDELQVVSSPFPSALYRWVQFRHQYETASSEDHTELLRAGYRIAIERPAVLIKEPTSGPWLVRAAISTGLEGIALQVSKTLTGVSEKNPGYVNLQTSAKHAASLLSKDLAGVVGCIATYTDPEAQSHASTDLQDFLATSSHTAGTVLPVPAPQIQVLDTSEDLDPRELLTPMELRISERVADGLTNKEVASEIQISHHTVNFHLRKIYRKLEIRSRAQLGAAAFNRSTSDQPATDI
ncbi:hypothetical protein J7E83_17630 [Arthrobacter sp. ISL-48]|uniref:LuxR family transcriptional regulator n=1 Tax=Arthrobacter sp. ISL-48 TaxID=2819110 RepID=UPI001BE718E7|nr:LuxR family transcriptional regulator [Arthrobacter sp. ISL-48]MBT2533911.1 hypothetical protein [Arthrobacter sp. ISL-48]